MQRIKKACAVLALTLALAFSAFAGEMPGGVIAPPDSTQPPAQNTTDSSAAVDPVTTALLSLLQALPPLF